MARFRILSGVQSPPSRQIGADGDFYVNTVYWTLAGPKALGRWPDPRPIWPGGMAPRPATVVEDDKPLQAGDGITLSTNHGSVLSGDVPIRK